MALEQNGCVGSMKKGLFVCTHEHPSTTSMQLNARLLTKKLKIRATQGLIQTRSEFMETFPPPPTSSASHCQMPFSSFVLVSQLLIFPPNLHVYISCSPVIPVGP